MSFTRVWPRAPRPPAARQSAPLSLRGPAPRAAILCDWLLRAARRNWPFALSEICKGLAIVSIGDMVIADEMGELILATAQRLHSFGWLERCSVFVHPLVRWRSLALARIKERRVFPEGRLRRGGALASPKIR